MADKIDKIIVTNFAALRAKYSGVGITAIRAAIRTLIAADKKRGLRSMLIDIGNRTQMRSLSTAPVTRPQNHRQNKQAIDGVYRALTPDYIMLLGSRDVIPHQDLKNPLFTKAHGDDPDKYAWGDLPYACDLPYSNSPNDFTGPTRVVGRLPDITAGSDHKYLVGLLRTAAQYKQVGRDELRNYFAVSAQIWQVSSKHTLMAIFGNDDDLQKVPPRNDRWSTALTRRRIHLFNCHGAFDSSKFYGQPMRQETYPDALASAFMDGKIQEGTIAAAECCYGGQLYPLSPAQTHMALCNVYLKNKSHGFFGSTTIAYGPARNNGQADLICRYFLKNVLDGASLGRAALEARQTFARNKSTMDPTDFKTLAQFNLYGDPSITPLQQMQQLAAAVQPASAVARNERHERRRMLALQGSALQQTVPKVRRTTRPASPSVMKVLRARSGRSKISPGDVLSFTVQQPAGIQTMRGALVARTAPAADAYHVLLTAKLHKLQSSSGRKLRTIKGFVVKEVGGKPVSVTEVSSR